MQTLIVVSALVGLAIAAPALPGDGSGSENTDHTQDWHLQAQPSLPDTLKREKKSPSESSTSTILNNGVSNGEVQIDAEVSTPTGRSFTLKKPLIVKKKYGYHVYRDSDEEKAQADSDETCGRQVKVKLCNEDKLRTSVRSSAHEGSDIQTTESDVKHSIKMAKEAVENLQRDLKKMEMKTDMKSAHESESDTELHEDIEVARQALKHIHENFGTLESMSLHAKTTRNSEDVHGVHVTIAKTEEKRMAQWKEAKENILKNAEIARNIEDDFKTARNQDSMLHLDQSEAVSTITDKKTGEESSFHAALSPEAALGSHHQEEKAAEEIILDKDTNEHLSKIDDEDDMNTAPSEMIEFHLDNIKNQEPLRSESHKIDVHEKSAEAKLEDHNLLKENKDLLNKENVVDHHHQDKSSEPNMDILTDQSEHHIMQLPSMKTVEEGKETNLEVEKATKFKTSENIPVAPITTSTIMKPLETDNFSEHQKSAEEIKQGKPEHHLEEQKSADDGMIDFLAKSANNLDQNKIEKEELHNERAIELAKVAENSKPEQTELLSENWDLKPMQAVEIKQTESIPKSAEQLKHTHTHTSLGEHNKNVMLVKSMDHTSILEHQKQQMQRHGELSSMETDSEMKESEEHHLQNVQNTHWGQERREFGHPSSMKAAEDVENEFRMAYRQAHGHGLMSEHTMEHLRNSHLAEHGHNSHDFELASHVPSHSHHPSRYHHNSMHSQMHDLSGVGMHSNFHPSMRDAMEGFGSDHMSRWKPSHESARVAYGSGLSSSSGAAGAVGVFPNANIGGCGIPLLLSCSPSVVSGSLAKAHSVGSYSSPSYRTEEDFSLLNKRDIKKTNDVRNSNILRSPTIVKEKSLVSLEKKM